MFPPASTILTPKSPFYKSAKSRRTLSRSKYKRKKALIKLLRAENVALRERVEVLTAVVRTMTRTGAPWGPSLVTARFIPNP